MSGMSKRFVGGALCAVGTFGIPSLAIDEETKELSLRERLNLAVRDEVIKAETEHRDQKDILEGVVAKAPADTGSRAPSDMTFLELERHQLQAKLKDLKEERAQLIVGTDRPQGERRHEKVMRLTADIVEVQKRLEVRQIINMGSTMSVN